MKQAKVDILFEEQQESTKWADGSKGKTAKDDKADKRAVELAKKAEKARLLEEEEASAPAKVKAAPKAGTKKKVIEKPAGPGAIAAAGNGKGKAKEDEVESFSATGIDDAIDLMEVVNTKMDKASLGSQAAKSVDAHPERRFKASLEAYTERELPIMRKDVRALLTGTMHAAY